MNGPGAFASFTTVGPVTYSKADREGVDTLQLYVVKGGVFRSVGSPVFTRVLQEAVYQLTGPTAGRRPWRRKAVRSRPPPGRAAEATRCGVRPVAPRAATMEAAKTSLLEVNNIEVVYHDIIQVLRGVSLSVAEGSIVSLLGTNGAGQDHHAPGDQRAAQAGERVHQGRAHPLPGGRRHQPARHRGRASRGGHGPGGAAGVQAPDRRRKHPLRVHHPQGRRGRRAAGHEAHVRALPAPVAGDEPAGRVLLGRRAADDRHRPRADGGPAHADAGRALPRARAAAGDGDLRPHPGHQPRS